MKNKLFIYITSIISIITFSCKKYVETDLSANLVSSDKVFLESGTANSAIEGLYSYYPSTYSIQYFTFLGGISSDEMDYTGTGADLMQFVQHSVSTTNSTNESYLWTYPYQVVGYINQAIDGLNASTALTDSLKNSLLGESKFLRAWYYFNLVNYFGKIPLILNSQALNNTSIGNSDSATVYKQIISDLTEAQSNLYATYPGTSTFRIRGNKWAATNLLAKVYLYQKDYASAITEASKVIESGTYSLSDVKNAFINTSKETIWQSSTVYGYSSIGTNYRSATNDTTVIPPTFVVDSSLVKSFDTSDLRYKNWIDFTKYNGIKYYRNYKYKLKSATAGNEYNVVMRLAETYLIRAEAKLFSNDISGALADINMIRNRAGLSDFSSNNAADIFNEIVIERKKELFGEFSNRWFDLKRWGLVNSVIGALDPNWKSTAAWMPIPYNQIILNSNLTQNDGY
ncbi:RagB/SusD family nutrient uptake outer membrane protein [Rhizosphaericola mali]|uniref:RagB/SusD family nutrient uptake outer membrane protein n=1 Tax=Rhizosphaericola mali TaxID=2545455 RepID=A0A5P2FZP3_9BACT|nr:RagB/SusD family nutrient uptake outer membrane protein [Rhizosphaericola mali]QES89004.1 RagB/SusD family nutrient uptake outer membrane protein [Rhizosphaericola mali]